MAKQRPPRIKVFTDGKPVPVKDVKISLDDTSTENRIDGVSGQKRSQDAMPRKSTRRFNGDPALGWSTLKMLKAVVTFDPFWELAEYLDEKHRHDDGRRGRKRQHNSMDWLAAHLASEECHSVRKAIRNLHDSDRDEPESEVYAILRRVVERKWPDNPSRRLSPTPISRSQYMYYRDHCIDDEDVEQLRRAVMEFSIQAALHIGLFDPTAGTLINPDTTQGIIGDLTKIRTMCDVGKPTEQNKGHHDPDAVDYRVWNEHGKRKPARGHMALLVGCRSPYPNERIILSFDVMPKGRKEGEFFADKVAEILKAEPEIGKGATHICYDMGLHAEPQDRILDMGLIPVVKVSRTTYHRVAAMNLGKQVFSLRNGKTEEILVYAIDGAPCIVRADVTGQDSYVPLKVAKVIRRRSGGRFIFYVTLEAPDNPLVSPRLVGARTTIRVNSTPDEIDAKPRHRRRTRALRVFPEGVAEQYDKLYGTREDTESTFRNLKVPMQGRVRSIGAKAVQLDLLAYQMLTCVNALVSHYKRTGKDLSAFFGTYEPIERSKRDRADDSPLHLVA